MSDKKKNNAQKNAKASRRNIIIAAVIVVILLAGAAVYYTSRTDFKLQQAGYTSQQIQQIKKAFTEEEPSSTQLSNLPLTKASTAMRLTSIVL